MYRSVTDWCLSHLNMQNTFYINQLYINICLDITKHLQINKNLVHDNILKYKTAHPIIGLHSTTNECLQSILKTRNLKK